MLKFNVKCSNYPNPIKRSAVLLPGSGGQLKKRVKYIFFIPINESPIIGETKTIVK